VKYYYNLKELFSILLNFKMFNFGKSEFSASLLQYSVSHDTF